MRPLSTNTNEGSNMHVFSVLPAGMGDKIVEYFKRG